MSQATSQAIVIVGGGHAGAQLCAALVEAGAGARTHLLCAEAELPYQRPPLSKSFIKNAAEALALHRPEAWYAQHGLTLRLGDAVASIDRVRRVVVMASGGEVAYGQLVLATGARARSLPSLPEHLTNVAVLRDAADAKALRDVLPTTKTLTVLGGGFIGLEIAATARAMGLDVEILESAPRLLARSVSLEVGRHVENVHAEAGIRFRMGVRVGEIEVDGDRLVALQVDGVRQSVERLVLGIGAMPDTALALAAGLEVENGVVVDASMRTSDPAIYAIGDCANFALPEPVLSTSTLLKPQPQAQEHASTQAPSQSGQQSPRRMRLESVQNANDHAKIVAATLTGRPAPDMALPWFWSEQGGLRLQMAGLLPATVTRTVRRPGANPAAFSLFHYEDERLACVESINAPMDFLAARKIMEAGKSPEPAKVGDIGVALKSLV